MKYAIIRDPHKCMPYTSTTVDGIPANREEWQKHNNFYPTYEVVGEVLYVNGITVLKVDDGIYVPMDGGLEEISEQQFLENKSNWKDLRGDTLHSWKHLDEYIEQKYRKTLPQPGILLSKANYYMSVFGRQKAEHPGNFHSALQDYAVKLSIEYDLGKGTLLEDATIISRLAKTAIREGGGKQDDNIIAAWVIGVFSEAYFTVLHERKGIDFESVFRESFIAFLKSFYE